MRDTETNRFEGFFKEDQYILLKNYLYNYLLRKRAVEKSLNGEKIEIALEVGSGISPLMTKTHPIIYTDLSFTAIQVLRRINKKGWYVVADGTKLPFKSDIFSHSGSVATHEYSYSIAVTHSVGPTGCCGLSGGALVGLNFYAGSPNKRHP